MIVIATWPLMRLLQARLGGRRGLAVAVMSLGLLLVLIVPLYLAVASIVEHSGEIVALVKSIPTRTLPPPPDWVDSLPLVGEKIAAGWREIAAGGAGGLAAYTYPYALQIGQWLASQAGNLGIMFVHFLLTIALSSILYFGGESAASGVRRFFRRLAGERGEQAAHLAAQAIRAVALGVVVTALAQAALAGIGLLITGVPYAGLLAALAFMLCLVQLGPLLVLAPAVIWLYWTGDAAWGTVLLIITIVAVTMDNFLRPMLIKRGADLPLLLVLAGVIGGLIAFGIIGLFIGPVVLAVTYTLGQSWVADGEHASTDRAA
jgi:predicted PurR-regulated permease PerM